MLALNQSKRWVSILLILVLSYSLISPAGAANQAKDDITGHWAENQLRSWVEKGLLKGYADGSYQPDRQMSRVEFITLLNRAFALTGHAKPSYTDLPSNNWAYEQVAIAVHQGYVAGYTDGTFRPNQKVTREQAAIMVAKLLKVETDKIEPSFRDIHDLSKESKVAIATLVHAKVMKGMPDGTFNPQGIITRAQGVTLLDAAYAYAHPVLYLDKPVVTGPDEGEEKMKGDVVIESSGATLQNVTVEGNLIVSEAVGNGDVSLKGVKVLGDTIIRGGGENSVHIENSTIAHLLVEKDKVRIVIKGSTVVKETLLLTGAKIVVDVEASGGIDRVVLAVELPSGSRVELLGTFKLVEVRAAGISLRLEHGSIQELVIESTAKDSKITVDKETVLIKLVLNAVASLLGEGKIELAVVHRGGAGSYFKKGPQAAEGEGVNDIIIAPDVAGGMPGPIGNPSTPAPTVTPTPTSSATPTPTSSVTPTPSSSSQPTQNPSPNPCVGPSCTGPSKLRSIQVGDYTLNQLNLLLENTGVTGFDPDVKRYSVIFDEYASGELNVSFEKASQESTVRYYIFDNGGGIYSVPGIGSDSFQIKLQAYKDLEIVFYIAGKEAYTIQLLYPRTIQEGFLLKPSNETTGYQFVSGAVKGIKLNDEYLIQIYRTSTADIPFVQCVPSNCIIQTTEFDEDVGVWYVKILHKDEVFIEEYYEYNLLPIPLLTNSISVRALALSKKELLDFAAENNTDGKTVTHGFSISYDKTTSEYPEAHYIGFYYEEMKQVVTKLPEPALIDQAKIDIAPKRYGSYSLSSYREIKGVPADSPFQAHYYGSKDGLTGVNDLFLYIYLYDAYKNIIGYQIIPVTFDEDHVADGYTPNRNWRPTNET